MKQNSTAKRPQKLQHKLFKYYLLMPLLILTAFSIFFYTYVSRILINREVNSLQTLEDTIVSGVNRNLNDLDQISSNINYFNRKMDFLEKSDSANVLSEYVISLNGTVMKADQINLYTLDGQIHEIGSITKTGTYQETDLEWYDEVLSLHGWKLISTPYQTKRYSPGTRKKEWYVSLYRTAVNSSNQTIGVIETVRRCKKLFNSISSYDQANDQPARVYIFDDKGSLIYPYDSVLETDSEYFSVIKKIQSYEENNAPESIEDPVTHENCHYVLEHSNYNGWNYLILQDDRIILKPVNSMLRILIGILSIMLLLSVVLSMVLARAMVRPVKHLKHIIQRVQLDNLGEEAITDYKVPYEELNELYVEFEKMNDSLKNSLTELTHTRNLELKSRVTALQVQMNPHFYYNTLSCISILAENSQTEEVTKLCQTLSMIMRYITDTEAFIIPVKEEINYIEKYLYCMEIRYEDSLNYSIRIPEEILSQSIPKLILQPLVENAIKYGTNCLPPWHLSINGEYSDDGWTITVTDSGTGFQKEVLTNLAGQMKRVDEAGYKASDGLKIGGLGLINVYIRWKLYCKEGAVFEYGNTAEGHAYIRIGRKL